MSTSNPQLPTIEELQSWLRYEDGRLYWLKGRKAGIEAGCQRKDGRVVVRIGGRAGPLLLRYRIVWALLRGEWPTGEIDHIDLDATNDRIENLRIATPSQNKANNRCRNKTGYKGISAGNGGYSAEIQKNGVHTYLGFYKTPEDAHEVYCLAADMLYGEFARHG